MLRLGCNIGAKNGDKLRIQRCICAQMCAMGKYVPNYAVGTEPSAHCAPRCIITQFSRFRQIFVAYYIRIAPCQRDPEHGIHEKSGYRIQLTHQPVPSALQSKIQTFTKACLSHPVARRQIHIYQFYSFDHCKWCFGLY